MSRRRESNPYLGIGIYTAAQAARLTGIPAQSLRRWARGYRYPYRGAVRAQQPLIRAQLPDLDDAFALGFLDLMEARFIHAFRKHGVSLHAIRLAADEARQVLRTSHPFSRHAFKTDGRTIFAEIADDARDPTLLDLVRRQYAFRRVLAPYLYEGLEFDADEPARWRPMPGNRRVVIDPDRQFGQPIVERDGVPTEVLAASFQAEQSLDRVARWFEVEKNSVRAAVEFEEFLESRLAA
jgi:uncharacterized protein (DUF433 family)/DNA-binding transcriptional MerR regulator